MAEVEHLEGKEIHGWLLKKQIGRGADGIVYTGLKGGIERAIKLFFPDSLKKNGVAAAHDRLELELQLATTEEKPHKNLVKIYAGGEVTELDTLYLEMELVPGRSLDKLIGQVPSSAIIPLVAQLASAAQYLDETHGLVHRDIKPANIIISDDFQKLTLLDFGIIHQFPEDDDDQGRLSGNEFVATLRYSPPEFVWRTEEANIDGAWRAVTFYQIGATLHDMIMGKLLFSDTDTPRARLYDSVRDLTPLIESGDVDSWLIETVQACLLKDWRQRLGFVSWDNFFGPTKITNVQHQERKIQLRQMKKAETIQAEQKQESNTPIQSRENKHWHLNNMLIHEIRTYLLDVSIFPKCSIVEKKVTPGEYKTYLTFELDPVKDFNSIVIFTVSLSIDAVLEEATKLTFEASVSGKKVTNATWTEMFTVELAFSTCQQSFLGELEAMAAKKEESK